ncbi:hypothetical protein Tco_1020892 [Tanacetum coccineum]
MLAPSGGGLILYQAYGNLYAMIGRKAHLLDDKQIPSVGVFSIWKAFGGNTHDLGSFGEETDMITDLHQHLPRISTQKLETTLHITRDAVTTHLKTTSQDLNTLSYLHAAVESLQAVETLQWENILTVGSSSNSGNHSTNSGNPLAFYSQQSSPKLDTSPSY